jgi:hypothetical protein
VVGAGENSLAPKGCLIALNTGVQLNSEPVLI